MEFSERIRGMNVKLDISDEEVYYPDVDVSFCAMKRDLPEMSIPVCWDDQLDDWTWQDVCAIHNTIPHHPQKNGHQYITHEGGPRTSAAGLESSPLRFRSVLKVLVISV